MYKEQEKKDQEANSQKEAKRKVNCCQCGKLGHIKNFCRSKVVEGNVGMYTSKHDDDDDDDVERVVVCGWDICFATITMEKPLHQDFALNHFH